MSSRDLFHAELFYGNMKRVMIIGKGTTEGKSEEFKKEDECRSLNKGPYRGR